MRHDIDALRDIAREVGAHVKLPMNRENVPHVRVNWCRLSKNENF